MPERRIYQMIICPLQDHPTLDQCQLCHHYKGLDISKLWVVCGYEEIPKEPSTDKEYTTKW